MKKSSRRQPNITNYGENILSILHISDIINEDLLGKVFLEIQVKKL